MQFSRRFGVNVDYHLNVACLIRSWKVWCRFVHPLNPDSCYCLDPVTFAFDGFAQWPAEVSGFLTWLSRYSFECGASYLQECPGLMPPIALAISALARATGGQARDGGTMQQWQWHLMELS